MLRGQSVQATWPWEGAYSQVVGSNREQVLPGVLLKVGELAEGFLTEVTTVGLGP
jgi:hypothetical protein